MPEKIQQQFQGMETLYTYECPRVFCVYVVSLDSCNMISDIKCNCNHSVTGCNKNLLPIIMFLLFKLVCWMV